MMPENGLSIRRANMKNRISIKKLNKDITLLKESIDCIESIHRVSSKSVTNLIHCNDKLASVNFQLLQIDRNFKGLSEETKKLITTIDISALSTLSKNILWDYPKMNCTILIEFLKSIVDNSVINELNSICDKLLNIRVKQSRKEKKKRVA